MMMILWRLWWWYGTRAWWWWWPLQLGGLEESRALLVPLIKAVISGDNGGCEIATLSWVTYPPAMNPRGGRRRLYVLPIDNSAGIFPPIPTICGMMKSCVKTHTSPIIFHCCVAALHSGYCGGLTFSCTEGMVRYTKPTCICLSLWKDWPCSVERSMVSVSCCHT